MSNFWGIDFQNHSKTETLKIVESCLVEKNVLKSTCVVTLNPELLLLAEKDEQYRKILDGADLKSVDGVGVRIMGWFKKREVSERIPGADLAGQTLKIAIKNNLKIAFVFRSDGLSDSDDFAKFCNELQSDIKCLEWNINCQEEGDDINLQLRDREVVFVGLGAPYQEKFIFENKEKWPNLRLAIGVGGTFDFWTGKQKRAPRLMRKLGFEWLWRLVVRPKRIWKIWRSTGIFVAKSLIK